MCCLEKGFNILFPASLLNFLCFCFFHLTYHDTFITLTLHYHIHFLVFQFWLNFTSSCTIVVLSPSQHRRPFLPAQSVGFQVPFNTVLITALSAKDNKFPLPAKTIRVERCRWKRCTRPYSRQGFLSLVATSAELEIHCPSCGRCLQCTVEQSRAARGSISGILERELVQEGKAVWAKVLLILEWGVLQRHFLPFNSY